MKWVYLLIAILTEVVATGALKASHSFTRLGPSLLTVDMGAIVGMALIIAGVIVINVFSKTVENH